MGSYKIFNSIAEQTLARPRMKKVELLDTFLQIEELVLYGVDLLVQTTTFVENSLCYVLAEIALGTIKSRKIYKGKRNKKRIFIDSDVDVGADNFRVLSLGFDLFKTSRLPRATAVPLTRRILRSLKLSTHIYESILRSFVKETTDYVRKSEVYTESLLDSQKMPITDEVSVKLELQREELSSIEDVVGCCDSVKFYGIVKLVTALVTTLSRLQAKILRSYQRMVLHPSREKSISENEALDLFQSGSLGLSRAISLYDVDNNSSFPSFAGWWIKQRIMGSAKLSGPLIKLPWSVWESHQLIRAAERRLESDPATRFTYTDADVAKLLNKSVKSIQKVKDTIQMTKLASLDAPQRTDDGTETSQTIGATISDEAQTDHSETEDLYTLIKESLAYLPPDEKRILCLRFGLIDDLGIDREDTYEVAKELLRQCACKARSYLYVTSPA